MFFPIVPIFSYIAFNVAIFSFITVVIVVVFHFMMESFICCLWKKCANLNKKVIGVLSFAMFALIYSLGLVILIDILVPQQSVWVSSVDGRKPEIYAEKKSAGIETHLK